MSITALNRLSTLTLWEARLNIDHTTKVCSVCLESKPVGEYNCAARMKDGLQSKCKQCRAAYLKSRYIPVPRRTFEQSFWIKVNKYGAIPEHCPELGSCWIWTGSTDGHGYGSIRRNGVLHKAHRVSYVFAHGSIDENLNVLHKCDNPSCVNPCHLFLGTQKENVQDMVKKGRNKYGDLRGENGSGAILNQKQVDEIRQLLAKGNVTQRFLAEEYGVSYSAISDLSRGRTWKLP